MIVSSKSTRYFIILLFAIGMIVLTGSCNNPKNSHNMTKNVGTFSQIKKTGIMRVGYIVFPPFVIQDPNTKELSGTFVDTIKEISEQMEVEVEWQEATWSTFIAGLQSKKFDISIAPTFSTISRAKSVAFTTPLIAAGNSAIVKKGDDRFKTIQDFDKQGIVVAVTQGEQGHEYAKTNFKNAEIKVLSGGDQNLTFSEVMAGRADVALGDFWIVKQFTSQHPELHDLFADAPYNITPIAWAVRYEDQSLLTFLNTSLE
jgi:ABC-type amino acid transport substrate-binding protein